jgi:hypothetical protein
LRIQKKTRKNEENKMNKKTQTFVIALAMMLTLTFGFSNAYGQDVEDKQSFDLLRQGDNGNSIVGTWVSEVTIRNCQTSAILANVKALNTFNQGGTMMEAGGGNSITRGPGHGTWDRIRGNQYRSVFMFFRFNPDGTYAGFQKVRRLHTLNDGETLTTTAAFDNYNAAGVLLSSLCATETAVRLSE